MRVLLMAQYFWPESVGAGVWIHQLAADLDKKGHQVTVLTAFPNYPEGRVFPDYRGRILAREDVDGVRVIRTWIYAAAGKSFWRRAIGFGSFCASALLGGLISGRPDVIYAILPPLPLGWTAEMLGWLRRAPVVVNIQDIYPDIAVSLGYLRNPLLIRFFEHMERSIYRQARTIVVIATSFRDNLTFKGVPQDKIQVVPNWADPEEIRPAAKSNAFRESLGVDGNLLVMYSGGMGMNTCLETVVEAARILRDEPHEFVLIGDGAQRETLEAQAKEYRLDNLHLLPFVPAEEYPQALAASDLQLVALNEAATQGSLPSKLLKIMASGRPVLALAKQESELSKLVLEAGCGLVVDPRDTHGMVEAIRMLARSPERMDIMGRRARQYFLDHFDRGHCVTALEGVLLEATRV